MASTGSCTNRALIWTTLSVKKNIYENLNNEET